jgi:histidyl-tRNA synthetase
MERLPGFRDFYPEPIPHADVWSADARQHIFEQWRKVARRYGFREYDGPPLEPLELFTAKSGEEIVGQLYNFTDKGNREVSLRPEMTPTLARMVSAHERSYKKPIKWFAVPQLFRYERQQKGRLREHFQLNADIIGESDPAADAELIALLIDILRSVRLTAEDFVIRLSSRNAWQQFFKEHNGDPAGEYEFFQIIDKLEREEPESSRKKLAALNMSPEQVQGFIAAATPTTELRSIVDNLTARGLQSFVKIDYGVIRGLAYYTGVVFEAFDRKGEFRAIAGGGRYDNLIGLLSGGKVNLPALGFGMGDVVLLEILKARQRLPKFQAGIDVFFLIEDEGLRHDSLRSIQQLRERGLAVEYPLTLTKSDKQFKRAQELGASNVGKLERADSGELLFNLKDLKTKQQHTGLVAEVLDMLTAGRER